jgi:hypothetical protein
MTMTHADPEPAAVTPRQAFDELLRRKVESLTLAAAAGHGDTESIQLLDAQCREFADAVDRTGTGVPYGDAVVLFGTSGPVVAHARDYAATPTYWQTLAGEVELIISGADVMQALHS